MDLARPVEELRRRFWRGGPGTGRLLLVAVGVLVVCTVPLLEPTRADGATVARLDLAMAGAWGLTWLLPWHRWSPWALLAFPCAVLAGTAALALTTSGLAPAYVSLHMLCFAWTGLFAPRRAWLALLPLGLGTWSVEVGEWSGTTLVRLLINALLWSVVAHVISELVQRHALASALLSSAARTDSLTALGNRAGMDLALADLTAQDTVVLCDLDHFKRINDTRGHATGDQVLADFGAAVAACLRGADDAARYGGEEFLIILRHTGPAEAADVTARIRRTWATRTQGVTFSAGIAAHHAGRTPAATVAAADAAMYRAKDAGRDQDCTEDLAAALPA